MSVIDVMPGPTGALAWMVQLPVVARLLVPVTLLGAGVLANGVQRLRRRDEA